MVQCDDDESFYRFPGGTVEFGETTALALQREFNEEFDLDIEVGVLKIVSEKYVTYEGKAHHDVTLLHEAEITAQTHDEIRHKEHADIKLVWRSVDKLGIKSVSPPGIFEHLKSFPISGVVHLINGFK